VYVLAKKVVPQTSAVLVQQTAGLQPVQAVVPTFAVWYEAQDPPADAHSAHVEVSSQQSVVVHAAVHVPPDFCFFDPVVQLNAEHVVTSQHDCLQLLSVFVVPAHFKVPVFAVFPVGHVYEEHATRSSAQHTASVEPTKFLLRPLVAKLVQTPLLYEQHFVESHSQQKESVHEMVHLSVVWFPLSLWPWATAAAEHEKPLAKSTCAKRAMSKKVA